MPEFRSRHRTLWLVVIALIILALIPFAIHQASDREDGDRSASGQKIIARMRSGSENSLAHSSRREIEQKLPPSHQTEDLKSFLLPLSELNNVSLEEALDALLSQYREICWDSEEHPIPFRYKIEGTPEPIVFAKIQGDFLTTLRHIATMAGTTLKVDGDQLLFTEIKEGPIVQRRWTVPPTFIERVGELYHRSNHYDGEGIQPRISMMGMLLGAGLVREKDAVSYLQSSSTFIARAGTKSSRRLDELISTTGPNQNIRTRIRFADEDDQENSQEIPRVFIPGIPRNSDLIFTPGHASEIEKMFPLTDEGSNLLFYASATEEGFGRTIRTVSITGELPTEEARTLYLNTGNISDLGVRENVTFGNFILSRSEAGEPQTLTFYDEHGSLQHKTFLAERIDATGQVIPVPE